MSVEVPEDQLCPHVRPATIYLAEPQAAAAKGTLERRRKTVSEPVMGGPKVPCETSVSASLGDGAKGAPQDLRGHTWSELAAERAVPV